ncbi:tRNA preQ1(34) S-adenosylmethionine ribosyltransferase-isomerase QueA [bacterium]|nr:tRNA preQ1(34) S-adenosylmethionine ribosyltransferase-isomerase QueA [bacterium]
MSKIFEYHLPENLIAQYPLKKRDSSRLMVLNRKTGNIDEKFFLKAPYYFEEGDVLVLNNSKVVPARLKGKKDTGGKVEVFLLNKISSYRWEVLLRGNIKVGHTCKIEKEGQEGFVVVAIKEKNTNGSYIADFNLSNNDDGNEIFCFGEVPLPPYIKRKVEKSDVEDYQTIYGEKDGSVAAHTAGLHFTPEVLQNIEKKGVKIVYVTLHIGWASFKLLKEDKNVVGEEYYELNQEAVSVINSAKESDKKVFAVGTSVVRALESSVINGRLAPFSGYTDLFIKPNFQFKVVDSMLTNFHLPSSTHLYLVSGFAGLSLTEKAYLLAVEKKYRFYSYGDSMLIL